MNQLSIKNKIKKNVVYLNAGEIIYTKKEKYIMTVLGSCISITMFDKTSKLAAICHAMYPSSENKKDDELDLKEYKYVDRAFNFLINLMNERNINLKKLEIKVFGGSEILKESKQNHFQIGKLNINKIFELLEKNNLNIVSKDVGGIYGRKLIFDTSSGVVYLKRVQGIRE